jgi:integrase
VRTHAAKLNEDVVRQLPAPQAGNKVYYFAGAMLQGSRAPRGFGVRVTASGAKAFVMNFRIRGREHRYTIGTYPDWSALRAVREARELRQRIDRGENPLEDRTPVPLTDTVTAVLDDFLRRYVRNKERPLRSADHIAGAFERLVKPSIGKIGIYDLRRSHIAGMLDKIEDEKGPVMADRTRAYFRKALVWYAERDDQFNFTAVFVRAEPRANAKDRARTRILTDEEIRIIWPVLNDAGTFGALVKTLLLTAQRRDEVAHMTRAEIGPDGIWVIPAERYKTKRPNFVPLSRAALEIIGAQPDRRGCEYVFPSSKGTAYSGFGKSKANLDKAVLLVRQQRTKCGASLPLPNWTLHDLRRTAKTLMVRAGVRPDISERVLGHAIRGVEGTYDRHSYAEEKRDALERLATFIYGLVEGKNEP